ncbi:MAG: TIGR02710 family CRISPR-associated protein [Gemmatimonadetes bacterium]|nr:MAG: TIGR02710 family CRISPR-associated protein [Gemmatimonadota bacterium]
MAKRILIMTLGTGRGVENGIAKCIQTFNPDVVRFITTHQGKETIPKVAEALQTLYQLEMPQVVEPVMLERESDVNLTYRQSIAAIDEALHEDYSPHEIYIDFTSGTKAMSVGISLAAFMRECPQMVYIGGFDRDENGRVITGSETIMSFTPTIVFAGYKEKLLKQMFNHYQFEAATQLVDNVLQTVPNPAVRQPFETLKWIIAGYAHWDKFDHQEAKQNFDKVSREVLETWGLTQNVGFLKRIVGKQETIKQSPAESLPATQRSIPELIPDLLENAYRRAQEGKYDDAVARLYRLMELIGQMKLAEYGFDTGDIDVNRFEDETLKAKYEAMRSPRTKKVQIGLAKNYELLRDLGEEELAAIYLDDPKMQGLLNQRNNSILAHGLTPISKDDFEKFYEKVCTLAETLLPNLNEMRKQAEFVTL